MLFFRIWLCHSNKYVCQKVQGILLSACEHWVMARSQLSPSCLPTAPCESCAPYSFLRTNTMVNWNKKSHIFYLCVRNGVRRLWSREQSVPFYLLADIIPSMQINSPRQGWERSMHKKKERKEEKLKWWSYWFVREIQQCTIGLNVHINLSFQ